MLLERVNFVPVTWFCLLNAIRKSQICAGDLVLSTESFLVTFQSGAVFGSATRSAHVPSGLALSQLLSLASFIFATSSTHVSFLFYRNNLGDCGSSKLYLSVCLCVCLSRFYGLLSRLLWVGFDETWWKCWTLGPID